MEYYGVLVCYFQKTWDSAPKADKQWTERIEYAFIPLGIVVRAQNDVH